MRLALKFTLTLVLVVVTVLTAQGFFETQRSMEHYETLIEESQAELGAILHDALVRIWDASGWEAALAFLAEVEKDRRDTEIRWTWLEEQPREEYRPRVSLERLQSLLDGERPIVIDRSTRQGVIITYKPVRLKGLPLGAIEFVRSIERERALMRDEIRAQVISTALLILIYAVLATLLGRAWVGRPIAALITHAKSVGAGEFRVASDVSQKDEIGQLAREMNLMSDHLLLARGQAAQEREARLASEQRLMHADRLASVGRVAAAVIHDAGTPLNVISGRAAMIADGEVTGDQVLDSAGRISQQAERITNMVRRVLNFSRKDASERSEQDIPELIRDTAEFIEPFASKSKVRIKLEAKEPMRSLVQPQQIRQVVVNLVTNAVQAMPNGGEIRIETRSELRTSPESTGGAPLEYVSIAVSDDGPGISPETKSIIFEPFYTTKQQGEGTGLGLAVCRDIVNAHGGWIELSGEPGQGATFTCYLPKL